MQILFKAKTEDGREIEYDLTDYIVWRVARGKRADEIMDLLLAHESNPSPQKRELLRQLLNVTLAQ